MAEAFWVIKHGIKASGMPAWGKSMSDEYVWNLAAFLQELPKLDEKRYRELIAQSSGHSHGGGETHPHSHDEGSEEPAGRAAGSHQHDEDRADVHAHDAVSHAQGPVHTHADSKKHLHAAKNATGAQSARSPSAGAEIDTPEAALERTFDAAEPLPPPPEEAGETAAAPASAPAPRAAVRIRRSDLPAPGDMLPRRDAPARRGDGVPAKRRPPR